MLRLAEKDWIHPMEWELDRVCHRISSDQIFTIIMKASTVGLPRRLVWCGKESRIYSCWFGACPCVHHALLIILACFTLFLNLLVCILGPPGIVPWACLFLDLHSQSLLWQFVRVQTSNTKDFINCIPRDLASLQFPLKNACSICPRRFSVFPLAHFYSSSSYTNLETCTFFFFFEFGICLQPCHPNLYQNIEHSHYPRKSLHAHFQSVSLPFKGNCFAFYLYGLVLHVLELLLLSLVSMGCILVIWIRSSSLFIAQ